MKLVKDSNAHRHEELFDTEDEAFAFLHGLHLGAHMPYVADTHEMRGYLEEDIGEAFLYGIKMGVQHRGRIETAEFGVADGPFRFVVDFSVKAE